MSDISKLNFAVWILDELAKPAILTEKQQMRVSNHRCVCGIQVWFSAQSVMSLHTKRCLYICHCVQLRWSYIYFFLCRCVPCGKHNCPLSIHSTLLFAPSSCLCAQLPHLLVFLPIYCHLKLQNFTQWNWALWSSQGYVESAPNTVQIMFNRHSGWISEWSLRYLCLLGHGVRNLWLIHYTSWEQLSHLLSTYCFFLSCCEGPWWPRIGCNVCWCV